MIFFFFNEFNTNGIKKKKNLQVYIADPEGFALIIFDGKKFYRLDDEQYRYTSSEVTFHIANESFRLPGGIMTLDLEPKNQKLFFANLASRNLSYLLVNELKDAISFGKPGPKANIVQSFFTSQPTVLRWSKSNVLLIGLAESAIYCWKKSDSFCEDDYVS